MAPDEGRVYPYVQPKVYIMYLIRRCESGRIQKDTEKCCIMPHVQYSIRSYGQVTKNGILGDNFRHLFEKSFRPCGSVICTMRISV